MAKRNEMWPTNQPGTYYVDQECIDCDTCRGIAPGVFARNDIDRHSYVQVQPVTPEDFEQCEEALDLCPTQAIGSDGNETSTELDPAEEVPAMCTDKEGSR